MPTQDPSIDAMQPEVTHFHNRDTFIINDISLDIPPENIQVSKEDMLWKWQTLRTRAATKVGTGRGNNSVKISIPFTYDMILKMHRLIVEFRHSPFCFVENRYLREILIPDWPAHQLMAFTMTSCYVEPRPGAANAWNMQIDLIWFNYLPYVDNYLLREEWETLPLYGNNATVQQDANQYSIGWFYSADSDRKTPRIVRTKHVLKKELRTEAHDKWSVTQSRYESNAMKNIWEMEAIHVGEEFDLQPIPSRMHPAKFVLLPAESRIYVRYINYLQRDALIKNFGFDPEADLKNVRIPNGYESISNLNTIDKGEGAAPVPAGWNDAFFGAVMGVSDKARKTYGLHTEFVPIEVRRQWVRKMLATNERVNFAFNTYQEIRFPQAWIEKNKKLQQSVIEYLADEIPEIKKYQYRQSGLDLDFAADRDELIRILREEYTWDGKNQWAVTGNSMDGKTVPNIVITSAFRTVEERAGILMRQNGGLSQEEAMKRAQDIADQKLYAHESGFATDIALEGYSFGFIHQVNENQVPTFEDICSGKAQAGAHMKGIALINHDPTVLRENITAYLKPNGEYYFTESERDAIFLYAMLWHDMAEIVGEVSGRTRLPEIKWGGDFKAPDKFLSRLGYGNDPGHVEATNWRDKEARKAQSSTAPEPEAKPADRALLKARIAERTEDLKRQGIVDTDEAEALKTTLIGLSEDGWRYYDDETSLINVWHKMFMLEYTKQDYSFTGSIDSQLFDNHNVILTNVNAGLSHIVVNIPILSHEFPTQQFLGSVEPVYNFEFALLDDQVTLDGIPSQAYGLEAMRSVAQHNARAFRAIPDSWCIATDHFLTRLFGSYRTKDFKQLLDDKDQVADYRLIKRTAISKSNAGTVEGQPGLSFLTFQVEESNPYSPEKIFSTSVQSADLEKARREVLQALRYLTLREDLKSPSVSLLLAAIGQGENFDPNDLSDKRNARVNIVQDPTFDRDSANKKLMLEDPTGFFTRFFASTDIEFNVEAGALNKKVSLDESAVTGLSYERTLGQANISNFVAGADPGYYKIDISNILVNNPELATLNWRKLMDYWQMLDSTIRTAERFLAEGGDQIVSGEVTQPGMNISSVQGELYDLDVVPSMWKTFQLWARAWVGAGRVVTNHTNDTSQFGGYATTQMMGPQFNWVEWSYGVRSSTATQVVDSASSTYTTLANGVHAAWSISAEAFALVLATAKAGIITQDLQPYRDAIAADEAAADADALDSYFSTLPLATAIAPWLRDKYQDVIGTLLNATRTDGTIPPTQEARDSLRLWLESCGNWVAGYGRILNWLLWVDKDLGNNAYKYTADDVLDANSNIELERQPNYSWGALSPYIYNKDQHVGADYNAPFLYTTELEAEKQKIAYFKNLLKTIADAMLDDPEVLELFGLSMIGTIDGGGRMVGSEAYPDMDLPFHPYYSKTLAVDPDFYYWNIYDDGGAFGKDVREAIFKTTDFIVNNCYHSLERLQGGLKYDPTKTKYLEESDVEDVASKVVRYAAEGTDKGPHGPTATAFENDGPGRKEAADWEKKLEESKIYDYLAPNINSKKPRTVHLDITRGAYGNDFGLQAGISQARVSNDGYRSLQQKMEAIEQMFGNKEGFSKERLNPEVADNLGKTEFQRLDQYAYAFDASSLTKIARDSSTDLFSQKRSMKRAFPTFKLFFIEEDEDETRFRNFDDFYTYNAVKDLTVVLSGDSSMDHAVITLQNVSGTLDGTKKNTRSDADVNGEGNGEDPDPMIQDDDSTTKSFGSIVLRPGINIQLRMGYSNDPDNLEVMISGRVVDLSWNKSGDMAEIMVQSFGAELVQTIRGNNANQDADMYTTTHQLLGSLLMHSEVAHFGRWEFGELRQIGESMNHVLDFDTYTRDGWFGKFRMSRKFTNFMSDHPYFTLGVSAAAFVGLNFFPFGKVGRFLAGSRVGRVASSYAAGTARWVGVGNLARSVRTWGSIPLTNAGGKLTVNSITKAAINNLNPVLKSTLRTEELLGETRFMRALLQHQAVNGELTVAFASKTLADYERRLISFAVRDPKFGWEIVRNQWYFTSGLVPQSAFWAFTGTGMKAVMNIGKINFFVAPVLVTAGAVALGVADGIVDIIEAGAKAVFGWIPRKFKTAKAQLFLGPQDDNIFPPHPKDYMYVLDNTGDYVGVTQIGKNVIGWGIEQILNHGAMRFGFEPKFTNMVKTGADYGAATVAQAAGADESTVDALGKRISLLADKRVNPEACWYRLSGSTIWDVFSEMTLRHPGWIAAVRPYGKRFEYRVFFGVPSQRWWSKPASNQFVARANKLYTFLHNGKDIEITRLEYENLYGTDAYTTLVDQFDPHRLTQTSEVYPETAEPEDFNAWLEDSKQSIPTGITYDTAGAVNSLTESINTMITNQMTATAMAEYLRALELRFRPFRRYHMWTSSRDIVANGLISSEQSVANAVEVTYFDEGASPGESQPEGSTILKAHTHIPDHLIRLHPLEKYPNCRGYPMSLRYGMSSLMQQLRHMYRGEIMLLGDARIRPYDIGIMIDTYNDMIGPIEVDQVVHIFSHQEGFMTEIKPAAVVIGNETSSWPIVEAMKTLSAAIWNIEHDFAASGRESGLGITGDFMSFAANFGPAGVGVPAFQKAKALGLDGKTNPNDYLPVDRRSTDDSTVYTAPTEILEGAGYLAAGGAIAVGLAMTAGGYYVRSKAGAPAALLTKWYGASSGVGQSSEFVKVPLAWIGGVSMFGGLAAAATGMAAGVILYNTEPTSLSWLMASTVMFLKCLDGDTVILVPLMKDGQPIASGIDSNDPSMLWKSFFGDLDNWVNDAALGTRDMVQLWNRYGSELWRGLSEKDLSSMTGQRLTTASMGF